MVIPVYKDRTFRAVTAIVVSNYLCLYGQETSFIEALHYPSYYVAVSVSTAIALVIMYYVHRITRWLDKKLDWRVAPITRGTLQFALGIVVPVLFDLLAIEVYASFYDHNVYTSGFIQIVFPVVVAMVIGLNVYYLIYALVQKGVFKPQSAIPIVQIHEVKTQAPFLHDLPLFPQNKKKIKSQLDIQLNGKHVIMEVEQEIAIFYKATRLVEAITFNGMHYPLNLPLKEVEEEFQDGRFLKINRSTLVNKRLIKGYYSNKVKQGLDIIISPQYSELIKSIDPNVLYVSRDNINAFKSWFE